MSGPTNDYERDMAAALEPWAGEDALTVAILLQAVTLPEVRAEMLAGVEIECVAAINAVERKHGRGYHAGVPQEEREGTTDPDGTYHPTAEEYAMGNMASGHEHWDDR